MKTALTTFLAPLFLVFMIGVVLAYPSPSDLFTALQPLKPKQTQVAAGGPSVQTIVTDITEGIPETVANRSIANADCFQDLAQADDQKLDRCAKFAYQTLIEVERYANAPVIQQTFQTADNKALVQQLKLAATEVCRIKWATNRLPVKWAINTPVCEVSEVQLASEIE